MSGVEEYSQIVLPQELRTEQYNQKSIFKQVKESSQNRILSRAEHQALSNEQSSQNNKKNRGI